MHIRRDSRRDRAIDIAAERLLRAAPGPRGERPLSSSRLDARMRREQSMDDENDAQSGVPDWRDDLAFQISGTPMPPRMRVAVRLWADGYTPRQIGVIVGVSRQTVGRDIRAGLLRCWTMGPVPFGEFSRVSLYRKPSHRGEGYRSPSRCMVCAAPLWGDVAGPTCGDPWCVDVVQMQRRLDRRRMGWSPKP